MKFWQIKAKKTVKKLFQLTLLLIFTLTINIELASAVEYSASFKNADLTEFINVVGKNLKKTIILDPTLRGVINVRSYDLLNEKQYYQFFLSVLEVYGFAVVDTGTSVIKVVKARDAKGSATPVNKNYHLNGDEMITRIVPVINVSVRELAPLLRQLNDTSGGGNVVHYDPSNIIMLTGRASVVNHLTDIIHLIDRSGDQKVDIIKLKYASALSIVDIVNHIEQKGPQSIGSSNILEPRIVADERTNSVIVTGDPKKRSRVVSLIHSLDKKLQTDGNTRVFYLRYAKAKDVVKVLTNMSKGLKGKSPKTKAPLTGSSIESHEGTNSVIVTAPSALMASYSSVIRQLDIRRAQVLVEAIIVEVTGNSGINLNVQWASKGGFSTFNGNGASTTDVAGAAYQIHQDPDNTDAGASVLAKIAGGVAGYWNGNWGVMLQALRTRGDSNILSTPSITTLDNQEASFVVGDDVPIVTGSAASSNNANPFTTVKREQIGVKLTVTPQINQGDSVQLKIKQEVSALRGRTNVDVIITKREVKTTVLAKSGETIILGGLIQDKVVETEDRVPLLGDIPYLGVLFRSTKSTKEKTNLMVFLRATIVRDDQTMQELSMRKYGLIRSVQRFYNKKGIALMPNTKSPILPKWNESHEIVPEEFISAGELKKIKRDDRNEKIKRDDKIKTDTLKNANNTAKPSAKKAEQLADKGAK